MPKKSESDSENNKKPERPLECGECKKPVAVRYTEIVGTTITTTIMCADCPQLERRLHGVKRAENLQGSLSESALACGDCGTTLEAVRVGASLGCSHCYEVFGDILLSELLAADKIPARLANARKNTPTHIGRNPGEIPEISPSARLMVLNEALNETLKREDYEQAALLRDQIKALTDKPEKTDDKK